MKESKRAFELIVKEMADLVPRDIFVEIMFNAFDEGMSQEDRKFMESVINEKE